MKREIIFWQNIPSIHQSAMIRHLSTIDGCKVTLVTGEGVPAHRKSMGWKMPDFGLANLVIGPGKQDVRDLITKDDENKIHIFSGLRAFPLVWRAFNMALATRARLGIFLEVPNKPFGVMGQVNRLRYGFDAVRFGGRIDFILAAGEAGRRWYVGCGYPDDKVFQYAYFVEAPDCGSGWQQTAAREREKLEIIVIASLIRRKGLDVLLRAASSLLEYDWEIKIVGDGSERRSLLALRDRLKLTDRVQFCGVMDNEAAMRRLGGADMLVLPSRYDGWGAVVNEALMRGVPVICSDRCGASVLLHDAERGTVFKSGSVESLRNALAAKMRLAPLADGKDRIRQWAGRAISGEAGALYLLDIVDYVDGVAARPVAPWLLWPSL